MNQDDIIRMAREAGFPFNKYGLLQGADDGEIDITDMLVRFAKLVAAAEREACEGVCGELANNTENSEQYRMAANWCRERIRARGNA